MSWLGWVAGMVCLCLFFVITLWSCTMLTDCYHFKGKVRRAPARARQRGSRLAGSPHQVGAAAPAARARVTCAAASSAASWRLPLLGLERCCTALNLPRVAPPRAAPHALQVGGPPHHREHWSQAAGWQQAIRPCIGCGPACSKHTGQARRGMAHTGRLQPSTHRAPPPCARFAHAAHALLSRSLAGPAPCRGPGDLPEAQHGGCSGHALVLSSPATGRADVARHDMSMRGGGARCRAAAADACVALVLDVQAVSTHQMRTRTPHCCRAPAGADYDRLHGARPGADLLPAHAAHQTAALHGRACMGACVWCCSCQSRAQTHRSTEQRHDH